MPFDGGELPNLKLVESAGYVLKKHSDPSLEAIIDGLTDPLIENVLPGGEPPDWEAITMNGELYVAGHFIEAAIAYYTRKRLITQMLHNHSDFLCFYFIKSANIKCI